MSFKNMFITDLMPAYINLYILIYFPIAVFFTLVCVADKTSIAGALLAAGVCLSIIILTIFILNWSKIKLQSTRTNCMSRIISAIGLLSSVYISSAIFPYILGDFLGLYVSYRTVFFASILTLIIALTGLYGTTNFNEGAISNKSYFAKKERVYIQFIWSGTFLFVTTFIVTFVEIYFKFESSILGIYAIFLGIGGGITFFIIPLCEYFNIENQINDRFEKSVNPEKND